MYWSGFVYNDRNNVKNVSSTTIEPIEVLVSDVGKSALQKPQFFLKHCKTMIQAEYITFYVKTWNEVALEAFLFRSFLISPLWITSFSLVESSFS